MHGQSFQSVHIACYCDKTDRAVRKLLAATLDSIRGKLALFIREQIKNKCPKMTLTKREFISWYDKENAKVVDSGSND